MNLPFVSLTELEVAEDDLALLQEEYLALETVPFVKVLLADLVQVVHGGDLLGDGGNLFGDCGNLLGDGGDLLSDGGDLLGDGGDLLGNGGNQRCKSEKSVTNQPTNQLT